MRPAALLRTFLLTTPLLLGASCDWDALEQLRRVLEGNSTTPQAAAEVEARIAAVETSLAASPTSPTTWTIAERMVQYQTPGVSVAVVNGGTVEWAKGYGVADAGSGAPVHPQVRFQAASISKPVTAIAALSLVEAGALDLDAPLDTLLQSWQYEQNQHTAIAQPTPRQVLTHTAGFSVSGFFGYPAIGFAIPSLVDVLNGAPGTAEPPIEVFQPPGAFRSYSGGGFTVLQQAIEDVTGEPFDELLLEHVLEPAGMATSGFDQAPPLFLESWSAVGHVQGVPLVFRWNFYPQLAAAGLWTTPLDLARLIVAVQDAQAGRSAALLEQASAQDMLSPEFVFPVNQGLGWILQGANPLAPTWFLHQGANWGYQCAMVGEIDGGRGVVVMTNGTPNADQLVAEVVNAVARVYAWPDF